jgi:hypothetical protein
MVAARKSMARKKANKRALVDSFFVEYRQLWRERYGTPSPTGINVRRMRAVSEIVELVGVVPLFDGLHEYLAEKKDVWIKENRHPLDYFLKYPERFIGRKNGKAESNRLKAEQKAKQAEQDGDGFEKAERYLDSIELREGWRKKDVR